MNKTEAIEKYLHKKKKAMELITLLMLWDEKMTVKNNAISLKISRDDAAMLAHRFALPYIKDRRGVKQDVRLKKRIIKLRAKGKTFQEIANILKCSKQNVNQIYRR